MAKTAKRSAKKAKPAAAKRNIETPNDFGREAVQEITDGLNGLLADIFALYMKTKNFHWHVSGPHFRDYHLLFDEQASQLFATTDNIAERARKVGGSTLRSIGEISKLQRIADNNAEYVAPRDMLRELLNDNKALLARLREVHDICDDHDDVASESLIENWIDQAERRLWFLFEASREADRSSR